MGLVHELTGVTPERDNDVSSNWRSSLELGGSPGSIQGVTFQPNRFSRGDCAADGRLNVTDAVGIYTQGALAFESVTALLAFIAYRGSADK